MLVFPVFPVFPAVLDVFFREKLRKNAAAFDLVLSKSIVSCKNTAIMSAFLSLPSVIHFFRSTPLLSILSAPTFQLHTRNSIRSSALNPFATLR
ncbi:hypothetical protein AX774_g3256 [Zancudomyces culisetae]|uniref:Uncharacterized protein n=1 Tax=Zancudomyces culisetae TaxID=1213189 RepID=A0A1R1PQJ9_ZANCU|nr:hypothetical protein AX774_g3256 [Zancudomyces culisetae]|eukprot:OMH83237.1 hypothetical protein AX774_g3256 [Zancudomyces culisetae]